MTSHQNGSGRLGWKIFAAASVALLFPGLLDPVHNIYPWFDWIGIAVAIVATLGIVIYAFAIPLGPSKFWRPFSIAYVVWVIASIPVMLLRSEQTISQNPYKNFGQIGAVLLVLILGYFTWLALSRLGRGDPVNTDG